LNKVSLLCALLLAFSASFSQPTISSFAPANGPTGTTVTINGSNFSSTPSENIVFFGAVRATVSSASATSLTVTVPTGATYQPISVTTNYLTVFSQQPFVVTFQGGIALTNTPSFGQNSFEPKKDFTTDLHPNGIALADLDGDGKLDVATPNNYSTTGVPASISVLRNTSSTGNISFANKVDFENGVLTYAIAAGDLNGDGKPDLIATSIVNKAVSVFINTSVMGLISFSPKIELASGDNPYSLAISDFDKDGRPDIVVANYLSNSISVYRNTSVGSTTSFASKIDYTTSLGPRSVAVGDFNGDDKTDIAVTNEFSNTVSVFKNTSSPGSISFDSKADFATGSKPYGVACGDLNNDGNTDLVVANNSAGTISLFKNTTAGTISFAPKLDVGASSSPYSVAIGDMNGDGKVDILVPGMNPTVHENSSTLSTLSVAGKAYLFTSPQPFIVAPGDMDGDGKDDITGAIFTTDKISVLRNKSNEPTIYSFSPVAAGTSVSVTIQGANFSGATAVSFGGVPATSFNVVNSSTITAIVGAGASGDVGVSNQYGTNKLPGFTFTSPPVISSFTPTEAGSGTKVTIMGSYFSGATSVNFGGVAVSSFTVVNSNKIEAIINTGATGNVTVVNPYGSGSLPGFIYVPPPTITSFTPGSGSAGTSLTITGTNLTDASSVKIGGVEASSFTVVSSTTINAVVADGGNGSVSVVTKGGTALSTQVFSFPKPTITSFTPQAGKAGTAVVVTGTNFRAGTSNNIVYFGAAKANVITATPSSITVQVPANTTDAPITIATNNHLVSTTIPFSLTFPDGGNGVSTNSFKWQGHYQSNGGANRILTMDIDGDGLSEIVSSTGTGITCNRNATMGTILSFDAPITLVTSLTDQPVISIGDLNNDGKPDIVYSTGSPGVFILKNTSTVGSISFAPAVSLAIDYFATRGIAVADFDDDGKADLAVSGFDGQWIGKVTMYKNNTVNGSISFLPKFEYVLTGVAYGVRAADLDGDKKVDLVVNIQNAITIFRNISTPGVITFAAKVDINMPGITPFTLSVADIDGDGKTDVLTSNYYVPNTHSIFRNTSVAGSIQFAARSDFNFGADVNSVHAGNLDGDGKPDLVVASEKQIGVLSNSSSVGSISFGPVATFYPQATFNWVYNSAIGDLDGDGKQDVAVSCSADKVVSIFTNKIGNQILSICPNGSTSITSLNSGSTYQWQLNTGNGYANISDNTFYSGSTSATINLNAVPSLWYGYKYRCMVNGSAGVEYTLQFSNRWIGGNGNWHLPQNWSCGTVPDENTDVFIGSGEVYVLANTTIRSLRINPNARVTLGSGYILNITH
jgi:hypothetical protein